jgi:hypothetical protein
MGVDEANRVGGTLSCSLHTGIIYNSTKELGSDPCGILGYKNEFCLVKYVRELEAFGLAPKRTDLRALAHSVSAKLGRKRKDNKDKKDDWFATFKMLRPDLSTIEAECLFTAPTQSVNMGYFHQYFDLLTVTMTESDHKNETWKNQTFR